MPAPHNDAVDLRIERTEEEYERVGVLGSLEELQRDVARNFTGESIGFPSSSKMVRRGDGTVEVDVKSGGCSRSA